MLRVKAYNKAYLFLVLLVHTFIYLKTSFNCLPIQFNQQQLNLNIFELDKFKNGLKQLSFDLILNSKQISNLFENYFHNFTLGNQVILYLCSLWTSRCGLSTITCYHGTTSQGSTGHMERECLQLLYVCGRRSAQRTSSPPAAVLVSKKP